MEHVGGLIRHYRGEAGLTQEELAERAGLAPSSVVHLESGEVKRPRAKTLAKLAAALGVDPREFSGKVLAR
jgi:transcriptional regulator with XRE-family HTH domain